MIDAEYECTHVKHRLKERSKPKLLHKQLLHLSRITQPTPTTRSIWKNRPEKRLTLL